LANVYVGSED